MSVHLPVFSHSELESFRRCPRLRYYRYKLRRRVREVADVLTLGTFTHAGLEAWTNAVKNTSEVSPLEWALSAIAKQCDWMTKKNLKVDPLLRVQAETLITGYHARWIDEPLDVVAVEEEFRFAVTDFLGEPVGEMIGKKDLVIRREDGEYITERKTTSSELDPDSMFWRRMALSAQIGMYWFASRLAGREPRGTVYDVIAKPKEFEPKRFTPIEKRKYRKDGGLYKGQSDRDEDPEEYRDRLSNAILANPDQFYARRTVVRLKKEIDESIDDLVQTVAMMRFADERGAHPRNTDACFEFNRSCDYLSTCRGESSIDDDRIYRTSREVT